MKTLERVGSDMDSLLCSAQPSFERVFEPIEYGDHGISEDTQALHQSVGLALIFVFLQRFVFDVMKTILNLPVFADNRH